MIFGEEGRNAHGDAGARFGWLKFEVHIILQVAYNTGSHFS